MIQYKRSYGDLLDRGSTNWRLTWLFKKVRYSDNNIATPKTSFVNFCQQMIPAYVGVEFELNMGPPMQGGNVGRFNPMSTNLKFSETLVA